MSVSIAIIVVVVMNLILGSSRKRRAAVPLEQPGVVTAFRVQERNPVKTLIQDYSLCM